MEAKKRLFFIDAIRAFAILMMLQGHFIDTLLDPFYRNMESVGFQVWSYFRGITAPTFFTISGLIFTFLLLNAKKKGHLKQRMIKGFWRGLMLIGIGYALRIPLFQWLKLEFSNSFFIVDVLQVIGLSLIIVVVTYQLLLRKTLLFSLFMFSLSTMIFLTEPLYRNLELPFLPVALANYFSTSNGSVFTLIPWFGYMGYGAFIATIFYRYFHAKHFKPAIITGLSILGVLLIFYSSYTLIWMHKLIDIKVFKEAAYFNYLFTRLGNVLLLFALFYLLENSLKKPLILKIGQKTLSIYVIHFIIIYGSFTGFGLNRLIGKTLGPYEAVLGALLFLTVVCFLSFYYMKPNEFVYKQFRRWMDQPTEA